MKTIIYFIILEISAISIGYSQYKSLNINTGNGLLSNHVYCSMVDHNGYLWIGSEKGVYRYNGYILKRYDYADGLNSRDIWWLYEDSSKKIWLYSISDQLGYIRNNKFKSTINISGKTLYPSYESYNNGYFAFLSMYNTRKGFSLCIAIDDTVHSYGLPADMSNIILENSRVNVISATDSIFTLSYVYVNRDSIKLEKQFHFYLKGINNMFLTKLKIPFHRYFIAYAPDDKQVYIMDIKNKICKTIRFRDGIRVLSRSKNALFVVTGAGFYELDTSLRKISYHSLKSVSGNKDLSTGEVSNLLNDHFWNLCVATKNDGLFLNYRIQENFQALSSYDLRDFRYVGGQGHLSYWWQDKNKILAKMNGTQIETIRLKNVHHIDKVIPFRKDSLLLVNIAQVYWFNTKNREIKKILFHDPPYKNDKIKLSTIGGYDGKICTPDSIYILSQTNGFYYIRKENGEFRPYIVEYSRYRGIAFDSFRNSFWLYNNDNIIGFKGNKKVTVVTSGLLNAAGIKVVEKVMPDRFGNIFLKTNDRLLLIERAGLRWKDLSGDYVLDNAHVSLVDNTLIIAGKFGVLFRKIEGPGNIGKPIICRNVKDLFYNTIEDMAVTSDAIILKTDQRAYRITIPSSHQYSKYGQPDERYRLIAISGSVSNNVRQGDTIRISQNDPKITFDLIKPSGNGQVEYKYDIQDKNTHFAGTNSNNLFLPSLKPDRYYLIFMTVKDEVWKSKVIPVYVYLIPYWWQKQAVVIWIWVISSVLIICTLGFVAYTTRRVVMTVNEKKNARLQLELKAIYAQINPHFIFNTLGVAQYFASRNQMQEATDHISKFSSLLRAYLKSSSNKYISIADEVANLINYIELQQIRFRGKFDYNIHIDDKIDPEGTKIPTLLLQPIVENAINHGLFHKKAKGHLKIEFKLGVDSKELICLIEDDGIGRKAAGQIDASNPANKPSYGTDLINDLIRIFKKYEQMKIQITYTDKVQPHTGTIVEIKLQL